jgi:hypothetical protein
MAPPRCARRKREYERLVEGGSTGGWQLRHGAQRTGWCVTKKCPVYAVPYFEPIDPALMF